MQKTSVISFRLGNLHLWKFDSNPVIKNTQLNAIYLYLYLKKELKKKKLYVLDYQIQLNTNNELTLFKFIYFRYKQKYQKKLKWWQRKEIAEKKWKARREKKWKEKQTEQYKQKQVLKHYKNQILYKTLLQKKQKLKTKTIFKKKLNKKKNKRLLAIKWKNNFKTKQLNIPLINYYYKNKLTKNKWHYLKKKIFVWLKQLAKNSNSINFLKKNLYKLISIKNIKKKALLYFILFPKNGLKNKLLKKSFNILKNKILRKLQVKFTKPIRAGIKTNKAKTKYLTHFKKNLKIKNQKILKRRAFIKWIKKKIYFLKNKNKLKSLPKQANSVNTKTLFNYINKNNKKKNKTSYFKWLYRQNNNTAFKKKLINVIFKHVNKQTNSTKLNNSTKEKQIKNIKLIAQRYKKEILTQSNKQYKQRINPDKTKQTGQKKLKIQLKKNLHRIRFQFKLEQKLQKQFNHTIRIKSQNIKRIMPKLWKNELKELKAISNRHFWRIKYAKELLLLTFMSFMFQKTDALSMFISKNFRRQRFPKNYLTTLIRIFDKLKNKPWFGAFKISVWGKLTRSKKQRSVELKKSWGRIDATTLNTPVFETLTHLRHKKGIYGMKLKIKSNHAFKKKT